VLASDFLSGVVVASLALMASVSWTLTFSSVVDWSTTIIAMISVIAIFIYDVNTTWLILAGGVVGLLKFLFG
jgi:chromate transporter